MSINKESDIAANLQIGPTDLGMVRIYVEGEGIELPLDFDPDEATEIAEGDHGDELWVRAVALSLDGGEHRILRACKRDEEGVALRVDLVAAVRRERGAKQPSVVGEHVGVAVAKLLDEPRRALDVGEEEGDGSGRQLPHSRPSEAPCGREF